MLPKDDRYEPTPFETPDYEDMTPFDPSDEWRAAPLSHFLGLPTLSHKPAKARIIEFDNKRSFGARLLSTNPTPFSSLLGLPVLKAWNANKTTSFGIPLLSKGKPNKKTSFGLPLLTKSKAR